MNKTYSIILDGKLVGTTQLAKADVSMGVAFGKIVDTNISIMKRSNLTVRKIILG
ncbi:MAG: hypothetical protein AAGI23_15425 [Bacteroidota bacterium]